MSQLFHFFQGTSIRTVEPRLQLRIARVERSADLAGKQFLNGKTVVVHFYRRRAHTDLDLFFIGRCIDVEETTFWGLYEKVVSRGF